MKTLTLRNLAVRVKRQDKRTADSEDRIKGYERVAEGAHTGRACSSHLGTG